MYDIYMIENNDTLESIANKLNTTTSSLKNLNSINSDTDIRDGMLIVVPTRKESPYQYYTIKKGDTIINIAKNYNTDYELLLQLNGLEENDYIYPNQTIILPKSEYKLYITKENDTLEDVVLKLDVPQQDLIQKNNKIYLREGQIIFYPKT